MQQNIISDQFTLYFVLTFNFQQFPKARNAVVFLLATKYYFWPNFHQSVEGGIE